MTWVKWIFLAIAGFVAFAAMEHWTVFERTVTSALVWLGYVYYQTNKEVDKLKLRLDMLIYKLDGRSSD